MESTRIKMRLSKTIASLLVILAGYGVAASQPVVGIEASNTDDLEKPPSMTSVVDVQTPDTNNSVELLPIGAAASVPLPLKKTPAKTLDYKISEPLLDLELPFKVSNYPIEQNLLPPAATDIFTQNKEKSPQAIRLDGTVLMTHEQETEKRKSLDGAGIAINIKP